MSELCNIQHRRPRTLESYLNRFGIEPDVVAEVIGASYKLELEKGEVFVQSFEDTALCFVDDGMLYCIREVSDSAKINLGFFPEGEILATDDTWSSLVEDGPVTLTVALVKSAVMVIPGYVISKYVKTSNKFFRFILDSFTRRTMASRDWFGLRDALDKRQYFIVTMALFYRSLINGGVQDIHLTSEQFGDLIGCSRTSVTVYISELIDKGVIEKEYRNFRIKDFEKLESLIENKSLYLSFLSYYDLNFQ